MPEGAKRASVVETKTYQETSDCEANTKLTKTKIFVARLRPSKQEIRNGIATQGRVFLIIIFFEFYRY